MSSPSPSTVLDTSALRTKWKTAKAAAEKAAGKNEGSKLAALHKEKMKDRLGPDLEDWPKLYPNWGKLQQQKGELDKKIDTYSKAVKESGLTDGVKNPMLLALKEIKAAMAVRLDKAEDLLSTDVKAAMKASKEPQPLPPVKWEVVSFDLAANLKAHNKATFLTVPDALMIEITAEVDGDLYKELKVDGSRAAHIQESAKAKADSAVEEMIKAMEAVANKRPLDKKAAEEAGKALYEKFHVALDKAGKEVNAEVEKQLEDYKKGKQHLLHCRIKSGAKIGITGTCMVAAVAVSAASHGAFTPIAAVGIARGGFAIAQECAKLASTCDQVAAVVKTQFAALRLIMEESLADATIKSQIKQGVKLVGLGVLSGITGFKGIPSMKNVDDNIKLHKTNITKLDTESHELSKKLGTALHEQDEWKRTNEATIKSLPPDKASKVRAKVAAIDIAVGKLVSSVTKVNEGVSKAHKHQADFVGTLSAMTQGLPDWIKLTDTVAALTLDIGLAIGDASGVIDGAAGVILAAEEDILGV
jgi:hypothetical protein